MKTSTILTTLALSLASTAQALPSRELLAPSFFNTILKYTYFTGASFNQTCTKPPFGAANVASYNVQSTDTQASVYRLDSNKEIIVAFPGSASVQDFFTDFTLAFAPYVVPNCNFCLVHAGFLTAFNSISAQLNGTVADQVKKYPTYTVTITGGSLGGALGKLAFVYFKSQAAFASKVTQGWSFGEPRVGNGPFADYADSLAGGSDTQGSGSVGIYRRVTHQNDIVPQIPPTSLGYKHSRTEIWEQNNAQGVPDANHIYRCYGQEPTDCVNGQNSFDANAHLTYAGANVTVCCSTCV